MNNDAWIALLDSVPDEPTPTDMRRLVKGFFQHSVDVSNGIAAAFNTAVERIEVKLDAADRDRQQVTRFLEQIDAKLDAFEARTDALEKRVGSLEKRVGSLEKDRKQRIDRTGA